MISRQEFEEEIFRVVGDLPDKIKDSSPESLRQLVEEAVGKLVSLHPEEAARYVGLKNGDIDSLKRLYVASLLEQISELTTNFPLEEQIELRAKKYKQEVGQIPKLSGLYFPNENVVLFRLAFPPSLEEYYTLYSETGRKVASGVDIHGLFQEFPIYGVFRIVRVLKDTELGSRELSELERKVSESQLQTVGGFEFLYISPRIINYDLDKLAPNVKGPLNKMFDKDRPLYHTTDREFSAIPVPQLQGYDKVDVLQETGIFGVRFANWPTYLSADESMSLSHYSQQGTQLGRVYEVVVNSQTLAKSRNIFIDPESATNVNELGKNFIVGGGIPIKSLREIRELERMRTIIKGERVI